MSSGEEIPIQGEDKNETQKKLESLIGMSRELFSQIILFGKGGMARFSSLGDGQKKQLIEEVLDVAVYEKAIEASRKRMNYHVKNKGRLEQELESTREHKVTAKNRVDDLKLMKDEWLERRESEREVLEGEIEQLQCKVEENKGIERDDPTDYEFKLREIDLEIVSHQEERDELSKKSRNLEKKFSIKQRELMGVISEKKATLSFLEKEHKRIDELIFNGCCPTCGQKTDKDVFGDVEEFPKKINDARVALNKAEVFLDNLENAKD